MSKTDKEFDEIIRVCRDLFEAKLRDYGPSWRVLRLSSLTDQIYIKANRIRSVQEAGVMKINEDISSEFIGIINYSIIALIQLELEKQDKEKEIPNQTILELYDEFSNRAKKLMQDKNHDYGEAWREMRVSSIVDLILMKIMRLKQIEDNQGKVFVSEGVEANYNDIINYAVFASIKIRN
ncbi:MAG: DUF1599 domain-containing protein [Bacteroidales bacterium]|jgi:hypothetical protein|nr:DUF1599 domain-containing protein [Bacteroidales bacterium]MDY0053510.1 DUF1599 domain-containing protein [Bacteroidales bacterium]